MRARMYLILEVSLEEKESQTLVNRVLNILNLKLGSFYSLRNIPISCWEKTFKELRPRVNLQHFNEEYVKTVIGEVFLENMFNETTSFLRENLEKFKTNSKGKRKGELTRDAKILLKKVPKAYIDFIPNYVKYLEQQIKENKSRINFLKERMKGINLALKQRW